MASKLTTLLTFTLLASCMTLAAPLACAQQRNLSVGSKTTDVTENRVALVIGNSAYRTSPLKNPVNDAHAMASKLQTLGFDVIERDNLTQRQIGSVLRAFRAKLKPGSVALFFYAGHGVQVKGSNYLPTIDADIASEDDVPLQSMNLNQVLELMEEAKTRMNLVFLDACRNNPYATNFRSASTGLSKVNAPSGTLISFATRPGSVAADGGGKNGIYTEKLLSNMDMPLPIEQILKNVVSGVRAATKGRQEPWMEGSIEGDFYFVPGAALAMETPILNMELAYWNSARKSGDRHDYELYLNKFPNGSFAEVAQLKLATIKREEDVKPEKKPYVIETKVESKIEPTIEPEIKPLTNRFGFTIGDRYSMRQIDRNRRGLVVSTLDIVIGTIQKDGTLVSVDRLVTLKADGTPQRITNIDGTYNEWSDGYTDRVASENLAIGYKQNVSWTRRYKQFEGEGDEKHTGTIEVVGMEMVKVPAGQFKAYKIVRKTSFTGNRNWIAVGAYKGKALFTSWFVPALHTIVASEIEFDQVFGYVSGPGIWAMTPDRYRDELTSYQLAQEQTTLKN
jgi:hypothetical protein